MLSTVLQKYGIEPGTVPATPYGSGLINNTWKVNVNDKQYILQRINSDVFKNPRDIAHNIRLIGNYLKNEYPEYPFIMPEKAADGNDLVFSEAYGYFRLFPFIKGSHTIDAVSTPDQAYEAARQFGRFTRLLNRMMLKDLKITLPDFHHIGIRYRRFQDAVKNGNRERVAETREVIRTMLENVRIIEEFERLKEEHVFKLRVAHHDTKISNVLFDGNNKGTHVIDLDTVMPGYFISDVGDMLRTYLSPVNEEEADISKIYIRDDYLKAVKEGYFSEMDGVLTDKEKEYFVFAGKYMIYMQALRFLTDYLNNDAYYGSRYEGHNRVRACNQLALLKALASREKDLLNL